MDSPTKAKTAPPPASSLGEPTGVAASGLAEPGDGTDLRKPHEMIVLMPRSRRVTLTGRRLYNALLQVAQARLSVMDAMPPADFMFEAPLPALLRSSGSSGEDRTAAKRYLREMRGLEVDWESTAAGDGVKWRGFSMLSEVSIALRHGENWVAWSYPPTMMAALKEPTRWARIDLDMLARLGTYAAVALYEICARYRDNPSGLTSRKPVLWWADALSAAPNGSDRREWRKFKSERVKEAIEEINRETDLEIDLIEHKQGRAVVDAQFAVRRKRAAARPAGRRAAPVDAHLVLRAESLGIRELKLDGLIQEFGEAAVRDKVEQLERRSANQRLRGVDNAYAYLRALLRHEGSAGDADAAAPAAEAGSASPTPPVASDGRPATGTDPAPGSSAASPSGQAAQAGRGSAVRAVESGAPTLHDLWLAARIAQVKSELAALEPMQRQPYVTRALSELADRGLLSAVVSRRAAQGDVLHGMLGSVIARLYALDQHGVGWDRPPADLGR